MKRILSALLFFVMLFSFAGCQRAMYNEEALIERARKELNVSDAETVEMKLIGEITEGDKVILWFMSGNEYQAHNYLPMRCRINEDGGYVFEHVYKPLDRGTDIVVLVHAFGGYAFCVNNTKCKTIKIDDVSGTKEVEVTEYPFIYFNKLLPGEYSFLDENGKEVY